MNHRLCTWHQWDLKYYTSSIKNEIGMWSWFMDENNNIPFGENTDGWLIYYKRKE